MLVSAELRWFCKGAVSATFAAWFLDDARRWGASSFASRTDSYVRDDRQTELGIKARNASTASASDQVEIKGLVAVRPRQLAFANLTPCSIEIWCKWTSHAVTPKNHAPNESVTVSKRRALRSFAIDSSFATEIAPGSQETSLHPADGCNVELTLIDEIGGSIWWTLGFEAFGSLETIENNLQSVVALMQSRQPPDIPSAPPSNPNSYPGWLSGLHGNAA